jgi:hypothetical protein
LQLSKISIGTLSCVSFGLPLARAQALAASIHADHLTGDEPGPRAGQERNEVGDVIRGGEGPRGSAQRVRDVCAAVDEGIIGLVAHAAALLQRRDGDTGVDVVDPDAVGCQVNRSTPGDVVDSSLATAVRTESSKGLLAVDRGDRDDRRTRVDASFDQMRRRVHHHLERCTCICVEVVVEVGERRTACGCIRAEGAALQHARTVDERGQASEFPHGLRDHALARADLRQVGRDVLAPHLGGKGLQGRLVAPRRADLGACEITRGVEKWSPPREGGAAVRRCSPSATNIFAMARPMPDDAPVTSASLPVRAMGAAAAVGTVAAAVDDALTCSAVFCSIHRGNHDRGAAPAGLHGSGSGPGAGVCVAPC